MTNQIIYRYFIRSGWEERTEAPGVIGANFLKTLDALSDIDPLFANWEVFDPRNGSSLSLAAARPRIGSIIENNVARGDAGQPLPAYGYDAGAMVGEADSPRSVTFSLHAGGQFEGNAVLEFAQYDVVPDLAIVTYPLFRAALLAINAVWRAPWACAQAFRSGAIEVPMDIEGLPGNKIVSLTQVPLDPTFPRTVFHIPWIAYLSAERAAGVGLAREILTERVPDGGLLMSATTERLDPMNPEHVRGARILVQTLIARKYRDG
jgi:hypothetical protein